MSFPKNLLVPAGVRSALDPVQSNSQGPIWVTKTVSGHSCEELIYTEQINRHFIPALENTGDNSAQDVFTQRATLSGRSLQELTYTKQISRHFFSSIAGEHIGSLHPGHVHPEVAVFRRCANPRAFPGFCTHAALL